MTDEAILDQITAFRTVYYACTGRMLADHFGVRHITMQRRLERLYIDGRVDWSPVVGSIIAVDRVTA